MASSCGLASIRARPFEVGRSGGTTFSIDRSIDRRELITVDPPSCDVTEVLNVRARLVVEQRSRETRRRRAREAQLYFPRDVEMRILCCSQR